MKLEDKIIVISEIFEPKKVPSGEVVGSLVGYSVEIYKFVEHLDAGSSEQEIILDENGVINLLWDNLDTCSVFADIGVLWRLLVK